ncbi:MAG TPA: MBL fold metallo-hydrolase [Candidatus Paceibacterota bacterium]|nr:MBL fold metallo-hydrolase [Candidatus Paceibacterota bacterium]
MVINYFGDGCFRIQSGEVSLLTNPTNNRLKSDVVLRTIIPATIEPPPEEIVFPGEYESKGIEIRGFAVPAESTEKYLKTVYLVTWEDMRLVILGHLSGVLSDDVMEELGEPTVLFIPVGEHFLPAAEAVRLIKKLEPAVVIPSFYKTPAEFLKAVGQKAETEEKFVFKKKDLLETKGRIIVLEAKV